MRKKLCSLMLAFCIAATTVGSAYAAQTEGLETADASGDDEADVESSESAEKADEEEESNPVSKAGVTYYTSTASAASFLKGRIKSAVSNGTTTLSVTLYYLDTSSKGAETASSEIYNTVFASYSEYIKSYFKSTETTSYDEGDLIKIKYTMYLYKSVSTSGATYYTSVTSAASYLASQMKSQAAKKTSSSTVTLYYLSASSSSSAASDIYSKAVSSYSSSGYIKSHSTSTTKTSYAEGTLYKITYTLKWYSCVSSAGVTYYTSVSKAGSYVRSKFVSRASSVTVYYLSSTDSTAASVASSIKEKALSYTGEEDEGDYLKYQYSSMTMKYSRTKYREGYLVKVVFKTSWDTTAAQEKKVASKAKSIASSLKLSGKSDYAKLKAIYGWMCSNVSYNKSSGMRRTAYGALINKKAVCEGYSLAFYYIANRAGLTCRIVSSKSHSWNMVKLGGKWYYLDCTWDRGRSFGSYKYFLIGSKYTSSLSSHSVKSTYGYTVNKGNYIYASLSYSRVAYSGSAKKPTVTVKNANGKKLSSSYYSVSYSNNKSIGKATVTIKGKKGYYSGTTITKTFKIVPKKVSIGSAKSSSKKKLTVSWKKSSGGVSYQIAYRKKGSSTWKYTTVGSSTYKKTLSSLTSGKYYYVKVRAYKKVSGTTYYGSWSSTKTAKVK